MKLTQVLQPEVVLGLRDRNDRLNAAWYANMHREMRWDPKRGFAFPLEFSVLQGTSPLYTNSIFEDLAITFKYREEGCPTYYSPKPFTDALQRIDREIPVDLLPERFFAYFAFAPNAVSDGEDFIQGMFVFIGKGKETMVAQRHAEEQALWMIYYTQPTKERPALNVARCLVGLEEKRIGDMMKKFGLDTFSNETGENVWRLGINLALYVNSIGADLIEAPPVCKMSKGQRKEATKSGGALNMLRIPVTLVSWGYHERARHVSESMVNTHLRWQRCGKDFQQVKLIWVKEHVRKYK